MTEDTPKVVGALHAGVGLTADGSYSAIIEVDQDRSFSLSPAQCLVYATTLLVSVARVTHEAALVDHQTQGNARNPHLSAAQVELITSAFVARLRRVQRQAPAIPGVPLEFRPRLTGEEKVRPMIAVYLDGRLIGGWPPGVAANHAMHVLLLGEVAVLQEDYRKLLTDDLGLQPDFAEAIVRGVGAGGSLLQVLKETS